MRRWLAILMLVLMPIQLSWAQAAGYDVHDSESGNHAMHFGHHDHGDPHQSPGDDTDPSERSTDADGHHCHGQCSAMPAAARLVPAVVNGSPPDVRGDMHGGAYAPPRPERPQWRPLA